MRSLSDEEEGGRIGWDDQVPAHVEANFREVLGHLKDLKKVNFPRSMWPEPSRGPVKGKPMLLIFGDGSVEASCALAYLRWEMEDGSVVCRLLAGKTRVAPKCKISIPRMELMGSLVAVRLYQKIKDSLRMDVEGVRFFTDSSAVLGMLNKDSGTFLEFVTCAVARVVRERLAYPSRASSRAKLVRIFGYVMMAAAAFKRQPGQRRQEVNRNLARPRDVI
jgi:hypothetical protein